jgi:hypothetical protein
MEPIWMAVITALVSSVIGSVIGAIVSAIVVKIKLTKKAIDDAKIEREKDNAELKELLLQNTKMTCRMAIYDPHFSVDEKLSAYKVYSLHGWNHQTKQYMDELVGCDVDEYIERHGVRS